MDYPNKIPFLIFVFFDFVSYVNNCGFFIIENKNSGMSEIFIPLIPRFSNLLYGFRCLGDSQSHPYKYLSGTLIDTLNDFIPKSTGLVLEILSLRTH